MFLICAAAVMAAAPVRCSAEPVWLQPALLYEITDYPATGFFQYILSISVNEEKGALYILAGTPDGLSAYHNDNGNPWSQIQMETRLSSGDRAAACGGRIWVAHGKKLFELTDKGVLSEPPPAPLPKSIDEIFCDRSGRLLIVDRAGLEIRRYDSKGQLRMLASNPKEVDKKKPGAPVIGSIRDVASDVFGRLFILDPKSRGVLMTDEKGGPMKVITGDSFSDVHFPYDSPSIAVDSEQNVWLINSIDNTIDAYDFFGSVAKRIESITDSGFRFVKPEKIFIDSDDRLYLIDGGSVSVRVFDLGNQ